MLEKIQLNVQNVIFLSIISMVLFNILMMWFHAFLGAIKNYTATKWDNKAWKIIGKLVGGTQKAIDYGVANKVHKP